MDGRAKRGGKGGEGLDGSYRYLVHAVAEAVKRRCVLLGSDILGLVIPV